MAKGKAGKLKAQRAAKKAAVAAASAAMDDVADEETGVTGTGEGVEETKIAVPTTAAAAASAVLRKRLTHEERLLAVIDSHLNELLYHSREVFQFARRCYQLVGKGCVYWHLQDLSDAEDPDTGKRIPLQYRTAMEAAQFEFQPVMDFIRQYDPLNLVVCLVAVKTGDARDSLLKPSMFHIEGRERFFKAEMSRVLMDTLKFAMTPTVDIMNITDSRLETFCDNPFCRKVVPVSELKACAGCLLFQYCGAECQAVHWKSFHREQCKALRAQLELATRRAAKERQTAAPPADIAPNERVVEADIN